LSIKFPDLQVLFPRAHETSRAEQLNQRQADMSQAQAAAQSQQGDQYKTQAGAEHREANTWPILVNEKAEGKGNFPKGKMTRQATKARTIVKT